MNVEEIDFVFFNQDQAIFSLNGKPLKLVGLLNFLSCSISLSESDLNICIGQTWTIIDRLINIWKSDLQ